MKKKSVVFLILLASVIQAFSLNSLKFSEKTKNLGVIGQNQQFKWVIKVKNISDKPVSFKSIKTTCGCTMAKPEKNTLMPGEETNLVVRFDSSHFLGKIKKFIIIDTSNGERYFLSLSAIVKTQYYLEPSRIVLDYHNKLIEQLVEVKSLTTTKNIRIAKINLPKLKGLSYSRTSERAFILKAIPSEINKSGTFLAKVILNNNEKLKLYLIVRKEKKYEVSPSDTLLFLNVVSNKKHIRSITITAKEKFNILTKKLNNPCFNIKEIKKINDKKWKIAIELDPKKCKKLSGKTNIVLKTDNKNFKEIKLAIAYHIIKFWR